MNLLIELSLLNVEENDFCISEIECGGSHFILDIYLTEQFKNKELINARQNAINGGLFVICRIQVARGLQLTNVKVFLKQK